MKTLWQPMRVEDGNPIPLMEVCTSHDHALGVAIYVARYPLVTPLPGVQYVVYKDGKLCTCETCVTLGKEKVFNPNYCTHCQLEHEEPGVTAQNLEASKAFAEGRRTRDVKLVYEELK